MKAIVLCDFDGTTVNQDVFDEVLQAFGEHPYAKTGSAYDEGRITHTEMNLAFAESLKCTPQELKNFLKEKISFRSGFHDFQSALAADNIGFALISGGWDIYIRPIICEFEPVFASDITEIAENLLGKGGIAVACNSVVHDGLAFSYQPHAIANDRSAPNKAFIATELKSRFQVPLISIGDGSSDYAMAEVSDFVFATGELVTYCTEKNIAFLPFSNFEEVATALKDIISKLTPPDSARAMKAAAKIFKCE